MIEFNQKLQSLLLHASLDEENMVDYYYTFKNILNTENEEIIYNSTKLYLEKLRNSGLISIYNILYGGDNEILIFKEYNEIEKCNIFETSIEEYIFTTYIKGTKVLNDLLKKHNMLSWDNYHDPINIDFFNDFNRHIVNNLP